MLFNFIKLNYQKNKKIYYLSYNIVNENKKNDVNNNYIIYIFYIYLCFFNRMFLLM
jgi:hypothetical protein